MIAKVKKGKGFRGLLNYLMRDEDCQIIGGNLPGKTPRELASDFAIFRQLHTAIKRPVAHISLSAHPEDRAIADDEFAKIAEELSEELGYANTGYVVIRHSDTEHQHIHIVLSRVNFDGRIISDSHDYKRAEAYLRKMEQRMQFSSPKKVENNMKPKEKPRKENAMSGENINENQENQVSMIDATILAPKKDATKRARESKRFVIDPAYDEWAMRIFPTDLLSVYRHPKGAVLYFDKPKKIRDDGDRVSAFGMQSEQEAAEKLVAVAIAKGWARISFTGNPAFVRAAIKVAMQKGLDVLPSDISQAGLIDEIKGEISASRLVEFSASQPTTSLISRLQERRRLLDQEGPKNDPAPPKPFGNFTR